MRSILCFGDSNTWGSATIARPDGRYDRSERWTGILRGRLGSDWTLIEEGLPGRTTVHPDPIEGPWLSGAAYLLPCLRSHRPLDAFIVMLGTNDLKMRFNVPPGDIAGGVGALLAVVKSSEAGPGGAAPRILVVCPPPILEAGTALQDLNDMFKGGREKSLRLPPLYAAVAAEHGAAFLDAGKHIRSSEYDGVHFDLDAHAALGTAIGDAVLALGW